MPAGVRVALETSSTAPSVAAGRGPLILERGLGTRPHASDLLPELELLLQELGARPADIAAVLVGTGPGSYTGLRVGVATALGLARGTGALLLGLPSGEALAWSALQPGEVALHLLDARAGELYLARYRRVAEHVEVLVPPCVVAPAGVAAHLAGNELILADEGAVSAAGLDPADPRLRVGLTPRAAAVLELGIRRLEREGPHAPASVEPLYLRAFAAKQRRR